MPLEFFFKDNLALNKYKLREMSDDAVLALLGRRRDPRRSPEELLAKVKEKKAKKDK